MWRTIGSDSRGCQPACRPAAAHRYSGLNRHASCRRGLTLSQVGLNLSRVLKPVTGCVAKVGRWAVGDSEGGRPAVPAAGLGARALLQLFTHRGLTDGARKPQAKAGLIFDSCRLRGASPAECCRASWERRRECEPLDRSHGREHRLPKGSPNVWRGATGKARRARSRSDPSYRSCSRSV